MELQLYHHYSKFFSVRLAGIITVILSLFFDERVYKHRSPLYNKISFRIDKANSNCSWKKLNRTIPPPPVSAFSFYILCGLLLKQLRPLRFALYSSSSAQRIKNSMSEHSLHMMKPVEIVTLDATVLLI